MQALAERNITFLGLNEETILEDVLSASPEGQWEPLERYADEFLPSCYRDVVVGAGHWGADAWPIREFVQAITEGTQPPLDVYAALVVPPSRPPHTLTSSFRHPPPAYRPSPPRDRATPGRPTLGAHDA